MLKNKVFLSGLLVVSSMIIFGLVSAGSIIASLYIFGGHAFRDNSAEFQTVIFLISLLVSTVPWLIASYKLRQENWNEVMKILYFIPILILTVAFIGHAIFYALVFFLSWRRFHRVYA